MSKWRIDWSTYDCGYEIIEAETRDESLKKFRDMPYEEIRSDREPYGEITRVTEMTESADYGGTEMSDELKDWFKARHGLEEYIRPLPCVRDEHGEIREQTVKALFSKINEELDELKDSVVYGVDSGRLLSVAKDKTFCPEYIAEEAADTITAITTLLEALGIGAEMRDEAQRRVNDKNRKRNRL